MCIRDRPVRALLQRAGFQWLGTIDPFDAGPHDGAAVADVVPIAQARRRVVLDAPPEANTSEHLVGTPSGRFRRCRITEPGEGLRLFPDDVQSLAVAPGAPAWVAPLTVVNTADTVQHKCMDNQGLAGSKY
jgi:arginine/ornithine N-succinyltransferase beta subunit